MSNTITATKVASKTRRKAVAVVVAAQEPLRIAGLEAKSGDAVAEMTLSLTMLKLALEAANNEAGSWRVLKDTPANREALPDLLSGGKARKLYNDLRAAKQSHKAAMDIAVQMFKARKALANRFADEVKTLEFQIKQGTAKLAK
jgi:hypothetical protein